MLCVASFVINDIIHMLRIFRLVYKLRLRRIVSESDEAVLLPQEREAREQFHD